MYLVSLVSPAFCVLYASIVKFSLFFFSSFFHDFFFHEKGNLKKNK